jgi:hypothetical protein
VARLGLLFLLLMVTIFNSRPAVAEVTRVTLSFSEYFQLLFPGAMSGRTYTPLVLVMPETSRVDQVISPFADGSSDMNVEPLIEFLNGERPWESAETGIANERYQVAVAALTRDAPLEFPLFVLVRMETPRLESDPQVPTAGDEKLESTLRAWVAERAGERNVLVIGLQAR